MSSPGRGPHLAGSPSAPDLVVPLALHGAYRGCRRLTRRHGTTYYWATRVLPARRRPHVHALYGFCRHADEIVDAQDGESADRCRARLDDLCATVDTALATGSADPAAEPVVAAVTHTAATFGLHRSCFDRFLRSMGMDLTVDSYGTWDELCEYMDGSAAVIGEMMLPVLGCRDPRAVGPARDLGMAFQLTNFLRDVGEDLDRGRVYLPREDLERFGVDVTNRTVTPSWRALVRFETERAVALYSSADAGIELLPGWSARSIRTARILYAGILDRIIANDYDVFSMRARVPTLTKLAVASSGLLGR
jgi:15-cis-phytoene synthase